MLFERERLSELSTISLLNYVLFRRSFALCAISLPFIQFLYTWAEDICLFIMKFLLKFRNELKHSEGRSSFASLPSLKMKYTRKSVPTALEALDRFLNKT